MKLVVPRAILVGSGKAKTIKEAEVILNNEPIVRKAIIL